MLILPSDENQPRQQGTRYPPGTGRYTFIHVAECREQDGKNRPKEVLPTWLDPGSNGLSCTWNLFHSYSGQVQSDRHRADITAQSSHARGRWQRASLLVWRRRSEAAGDEFFPEEGRRGETRERREEAGSAHEVRRTRKQEAAACQRRVLEQCGETSRGPRGGGHRRVWSLGRLSDELASPAHACTHHTSTRPPDPRSRA
ncbi:hypothetical protein C8R47DRAFT_251746 [Mycena vitilis]|nr:hypothetical protein C8R47DRAFT_251746 [Mycena vitilis]